MMSGAAVLQGHGVNFVKLSRRRRHQKLDCGDAWLLPAYQSNPAGRAAAAGSPEVLQLRLILESD